MTTEHFPLVSQIADPEVVATKREIADAAIAKTKRGSVDPAEGTILLRAEEVARRLSIGRSKVFLMFADGTLPTVHIGRSVRVPEKALREWIEAQTRGRGE